MIFTKTSTTRAGFTLVETLVVIFLASFILLGLFAIYTLHNNTNTYQEAVVRTTSSSRAALQAMDLMANQASRVLATTTVNGIFYTSSATTTILQLPSADSSGNVVAGKWDIAVFYLKNGNFYEISAPDPPSGRPAFNKLLSDSVQNLVITYDYSDFTQVKKITADITTRIQAKDQLVSNHLVQNMYLLNY
jgi:type II secretory pathway pseudopilin PulG